MIRLRIVKSARNEEDQEDEKYNLPHGAKVLKELVLPWYNLERISYTDSYFASVTIAKAFWKYGLRFIGVISKAKRKFTMAYLSNTEFHNRGGMSELLTGPTDRTNLVLRAFIWMYQNRW